MHDRRGVGRGQRRRGLYADVEDLAKRQRSALETLAHGFAFDEFRDQESCGVVIADLVDRQDVGMIERRCGPGLVKKAAEAFRIGAELAAQDLERHRPPERGIERLVDLAHATAAEETLHLIAADGGPRAQRHRRLRLYRREGRRQSRGRGADTDRRQRTRMRHSSSFFRSDASTSSGRSSAARFRNSCGCFFRSNSCSY